LFAGFCLAGAINLLLQSHPINSALSLIVVMTSLAVLYLLLGAEFLAAAQVIVYAGAIMVLFTFTVMLLNAGREERTMGSRVGSRRRLSLRSLPSWPSSPPSSSRLRASAWRVPDGITATEDLSRVLFHELLLPFEVTSVLILIAILGAVALARHGHGDPMKSGERKGRPSEFPFSGSPLSWYLLLSAACLRSAFSASSSSAISLPSSCRLS
jgi:NADH-quinone oxidoreductase subunit J